jgi:hypothetical protein
MNLMPALPRSLAVIGLAFSVQTASAAVFEIDNFSVTRNGTVIFNDTFSDGAPPPSAPNFGDGSGASYLTAGTFGPESGGLLSLNTANGLLGVNAAGSARRTLRAALNTNTSNLEADLGRGLKDDDTLQLNGLFKLGTPVGPRLNGFSIRFTDRSAAGIFQTADLNVFFNPATGQAELRWTFQDFAAGTSTAVASAALDAGGADALLLTIDRPSRSSKDFFASWTFLTGGLATGSGSFASPIALFDGERFVRAEFLAFEDVPAVPLPGTLWLIGAGLLAGLGFARRRQA